MSPQTVSRRASDKDALRPEAGAVAKRGHQAEKAGQPAHDQNLSSLLGGVAGRPQYLGPILTAAARSFEGAGHLSADRAMEYVIDAISETRKQDVYNKALQDCDIRVCLFKTEVRKYTKEEFDEKLKEFKPTGKPQVITFSRDFQLPGDEI